MKFGPRWTALILIMLGFLALSPGEVLANGDDHGSSLIRLDGVAAGPFVLRVITAPTPVRTGAGTVEVRLQDAAGKAVPDASIIIQAANLDTGAQLREIAGPATAGAAGDYIAHFVFPDTGNWQIKIAVESSLGAGQVDFLMRVAAPPRLDFFYAIGMPLLGLAAIAYVFYRLWRSGRLSAPGNTELG